MLARLTTESRFFLFQMHPYQGFLEIGYYKPSVDFKGTSLFKILEIRAQKSKQTKRESFFCINRLIEFRVFRKSPNTLSLIFVKKKVCI